MAQSFRIYLPEKAGNGHATFAGFLLRPGEKIFFSLFDKFHHETYQNTGKMM